MEFENVPTEGVGFASGVDGGLGGELALGCGLVGVNMARDEGNGGDGGLREDGWRLTWTSRPAVNARSPAPVRRTARTSGSWESFWKIEERLSHMLARLLVEFHQLSPDQLYLSSRPHKSRHIYSTPISFVYPHVR